MTAPTISTLTTEEALEGRLNELNEAGTWPVLPGLDRNGVAFMASLLDQGDNCTLVYIGTDERGGPAGLYSCEECCTEASDWSPAFPIYVLDQASAS